jgi:hypothetical protein
MRLIGTLRGKVKCAIIADPVRTSEQTGFKVPTAVVIKRCLLEQWSSMGYEHPRGMRKHLTGYINLKKTFRDKH